MNQASNTKVFDLQQRTFEFAQKCREFVKLLPKSIANREDIEQLVRSSGSVGANYIEANESLGKKDFGMRIKICRKESKESSYWLRLIDCQNNIDLEKERDTLVDEAGQFVKIFSAIMSKINLL